MGLFTLGEALAAADLGGSPPARAHNRAGDGRGRPRHLRARVRGGSRLKGSCERGFWSGFARADGGRLMLAAERFDRAGRRPGRRNGPLGHVALELLRALIRRVDHRTGRLDPALTTLMADTRRSRGAVVTALKALRDHGFLAWIRRYEPIPGDGPGPRIAQASNAYRLTLPVAARTLLGRLWRPAPVAAAAAAAAGDPPAPLPPARPTPLGQALARLERAVARESARHPETGQSLV